MEKHPQPSFAIIDGYRPTGGIRFDWTLCLLCAWLLLGAFLDGWAHLHLPELETFFTPWHGVLYSGIFAVISFLVGVYARNFQKGYSWRRALPAGYGLSLVGGLTYLAVGPGDLLWHQVFGIEVSLEGLLSPTHLAAGLGTFLIVSGPLRAGWQRSRNESVRSWSSRLPMVLSLAFVLETCVLFTEFAHPLAHLYPAEPYLKCCPPLTTLGVASILLQTGLMMGIVLVALGARLLSPGDLTLVVTLNTAAVSLMTGHPMVIPAGIASGIVADVLLWWLKPSPARPGTLRLFAFTVPVVFYSLYFLTLFLAKSLHWSVHLWAGSIFLAGIAGLLLAYMIVFPRSAEEGVKAVQT
ncbi:MAG TPA: hypothetical protein VFA32_10530 [Dehalococcoidia bacterium]|nr:hypothetical protein [Dehalococcoidia bacterium]